MKTEIRVASFSIPDAHLAIFDAFGDYVESQSIIPGDIEKEEAYTPPMHFVLVDDKTGLRAIKSPLLDVVEYELPVSPVRTLGSMSANVYEPGEYELRASTFVSEGHFGEPKSILGARSKQDYLDQLEGLGISPRDIADERCVAVASVTPTAEAFITLAPVIEDDIVRLGPRQHRGSRKQVTEIFEICADFWHGRFDALET